MELQLVLPVRLGVEGLEVYRIATTSLRNFRIEDKREPYWVYWEFGSGP